MRRAVFKACTDSPTMVLLSTYQMPGTSEEAHRPAVNRQTCLLAWQLLTVHRGASVLERWGRGGAGSNLVGDPGGLL